MGDNKVTIFFSRRKILQYISKQQWVSLVEKFSPEEICTRLGFKENMELAYDLFFKNLDNVEIQDFAVRLFFQIKLTYPNEWNIDWKNDAFLGKLCSNTWRYDEMYKCYKDAYDKLEDPPDSLLLLLAGCNNAPGTPPITIQESEAYLKRAIAKKMTYEAALMMRGLARKQKNQENEKYWDFMCTDLKKKNIRTEMIIPDVLLTHKRYPYKV